MHRVCTILTSFGLVLSNPNQSNLLHFKTSLRSKMYCWPFLPSCDQSFGVNLSLMEPISTPLMLLYTNLLGCIRSTQHCWSSSFSVAFFGHSSIVLNSVRIQYNVANREHNQRRVWYHHLLSVGIEKLQSQF